MHEHSWGKLALLADHWGPELVACGFCLLQFSCNFRAVAMMRSRRSRVRR